MRLQVLLLTTAALIAAFAVPAAAQTLKLGEVMVFLTPDLKPEADLAAFERQVTTELAPAWAKAAPGMSLHLVKKDRGPRQGQYLLVWITDTIARHKSYEAASGDVPFRAAVMSQAGDPRTALAAYSKGPGTYNEYHLVHPENIGAPLPSVDVLGNHHIKVRPSAWQRSTRSSARSSTRRWATCSRTSACSTTSRSEAPRPPTTSPSSRSRRRRATSTGRRARTRTSSSRRSPRP